MSELRKGDPQVRREMNHREKHIARLFFILGIILGIPLGFSIYPPIAQASSSEWIVKMSAKTIFDGPAGEEFITAERP